MSSKGKTSQSNDGFKLKVGSRAQVFHKTAEQTTGGLTFSDLKKNKHGRIVSKKASSAAKKNKTLIRLGFLTQKKKFGVVRKTV